MRSLSQIESEIEKLQTELALRKHDMKKDARHEIEDVLRKYNFSIEEIYPNLSTKDVPEKAKVEAKFKDPDTGSLWSGRGRQPLWVSRILQERGLTIEDFKMSANYRNK